MIKELQIKETIKCVCSTWSCKYNTSKQLEHTTSSKGIVIHDETEIPTSIENCTAFGRNKIVPELNIKMKKCDSYQEK